MDAADNKTLFARDGYMRLPAIVSEQEIGVAVAALDEMSLGVGSRNLLVNAWCRNLASRIRRNPIVADLLPHDAVSIQCTYFDKNDKQNWFVALHQDLAIPVAQKVVHPALKTWSVKEGQFYVRVPQALLEQLVAIRLHLDANEETNGPLRLVPGSHRYGRLSVEQAANLRAELGEVVCVADAGDCLLMRPLILHASSKASAARHRRVLHFVYAPASPGYGLEWQYVV